MKVKKDWKRLDLLRRTFILVPRCGRLLEPKVVSMLHVAVTNPTDVSGTVNGLRFFIGSVEIVEVKHDLHVRYWVKVFHFFIF